MFFLVLFCNIIFIYYTLLYFLSIVNIRQKPFCKIKIFPHPAWSVEFIAAQLSLLFHFEFLTQWDVNLIVSHINSPLVRGWKTVLSGFHYLYLKSNPSFVIIMCASIYEQYSKHPYPKVSSLLFSYKYYKYIYCSARQSPYCSYL